METDNGPTSVIHFSLPWHQKVVPSSLYALASELARKSKLIKLSKTNSPESRVAGIHAGKPPEDLLHQPNTPRKLAIGDGLPHIQHHHLRLIFAVRAQFGREWAAGALSRLVWILWHPSLKPTMFIVLESLIFTASIASYLACYGP